MSGRGLNREIIAIGSGLLIVLVAILLVIGGGDGLFGTVESTPTPLPPPAPDLTLSNLFNYLEYDQNDYDYFIIIANDGEKLIYWGNYDSDESGLREIKISVDVGRLSLGTQKSNKYYVIYPLSYEDEVLAQMSGSAETTQFGQDHKIAYQ